MDEQCAVCAGVHCLRSRRVLLFTADDDDDDDRRRAIR